MGSPLCLPCSFGNHSGHRTVAWAARGYFRFCNCDQCAEFITEEKS